MPKTGLAIEGTGKVGKAIADICRKRKIGVRELAKSSGLPLRSLYNWIAGREPRGLAREELKRRLPALRGALKE